MGTQAFGVNVQIARQEWLKPVEESLQHVLQQVFRSGSGLRVKNFLHGTWVGHPVICPQIQAGCLALWRTPSCALGL